VNAKLLGLAAVASLILAPQASAATFNIADGDVAALKNAINTANGNGQDDTIELATNGTYVLTIADNYFYDYNGLPRVTADGGKKLTIHGNGAAVQRSAGASTPNFRIFYIDVGANVTISRLTIANGVIEDYGGGAVNNVGGTLTITDCVLTGNSAYGGGAIFNDNAGGAVTLILQNCTISGNSAPNSFGGGIINYGSGGSATLKASNCVIDNNSASNGGGISNYSPFSGIASATVSNSTFVGNSAAFGRGGAIHNDTTVGGNATLGTSNTTFDGNSAYFYGGAIGNSAGNVQISNCTLSSNSAGSGGGTYSEYDGAVLQITNCTLSGNFATSSGGGTYNSPNGTTMTKIGNTILQAGASGGTIDGMGITSQGHNISSDAAGGFLTASGDQINTDPKIDSNGLQNNGGPTKTIALLSTSPAINTGNDATAPARDQRYYLRNGISDIGAFEYGGILAPVSAGSRKVHGSVGSFDVDLPLTGTPGIECRSGGATGDHQLVLTFASPVTVNGNPQAQVTSGTATVGSGGADNGGVVTVNGNIVTIPLTNVANGQTITVALQGVSDGINTNNVSVSMGVLTGDTNGDRFVDSADISQTKSKSGQAVGGSNFREDINLDGFLDSADIAFVKSKSGTALSSSRIDQKPSPKVGRARRRVINN